MNISVGQKASRSLKLTEDHVRTFADMTGDYNPLHFDSEFVSRSSVTAQLQLDQ